MANSIILVADGTVTTGVGLTKGKGNGYSRGCTFKVTVSEIAADGNLSGYLQLSDNGTDFYDTCSIVSIVSSDVTASRNSFAARFEGGVPAFARIRWTKSGGTTKASAKIILDD